MEQDAKESTGITRSQHSVLVLPHDRSAVAAFLGAALEKVDVDAAEAQLLILTPDAESTALVSGVASELAAARKRGDGIRMVFEVGRVRHEVGLDPPGALGGR